jgi:hypothetical protein
MLGYLNFSNGKPDPAFKKQLDGRSPPSPELKPSQSSPTAAWLRLGTGRSPQRQRSAFRDSAPGQLSLRSPDALLPTYRHHTDLLSHLGERDL